MACVDLDHVLPRNGTNSTGLSVDDNAPLQSGPLSGQVVRLRAEIRQSDESGARIDLKNFYQLLIQLLVNQGFEPKETTGLSSCRTVPCTMCRSRCC